MSSTFSFRRRSRPTSYASEQYEPDCRQINYEDMFTALVPEPEPRKRFSKMRRSFVPPPPSGQEYLDQLMFHSRTKPLPPLPVDARSTHLNGSSGDQKNELVSWKGMVRRWKHQLEAVDEHSEKVPEKRPRESSIDSSDTRTSDRSKKDGKRPRHFRHQSQGLMPWSTRSTNAANCRTLMYGDLAEVPAIQPKRSASHGSFSTRSRETAAEKMNVENSATERQGKNFTTTSTAEAMKAERYHEKGEVSRVEWEFMWKQYQQLSQTLQEALKQRTAELA